MPTNLNELKQCCKEEWARGSPQRCERHHAEKDDFRSFLLKVVLQGTESWGVLSFPGLHRIELYSLLLFFQLIVKCQS